MSNDTITWRVSDRCPTHGEHLLFGTNGEGSQVEWCVRCQVASSVTIYGEHRLDQRERLEQALWRKISVEQGPVNKACSHARQGKLQDLKVGKRDPNQ